MSMMMRSSCCIGSRTAARHERRTAVRVSSSATALPREYNKVTPLGNRLYVKVDAPDMTTAGGVVLPSSSRKTPTQGQVIASGEADTVKVGDCVVYGQYAGTAISVKDEEHVLLKEDDVVGVMKSGRVGEMQPVGNRLLVEISKVEDTTAGGVLLTNVSQETPTYGKVQAVGPGKKGEDGEIKSPKTKVGSTVLYSQYGGVEFEGEDGKKYIVIQDEDVLAELA